ncbi:hypothetical protein B0H13DRAFT_2044506 [Mycena leptocephala]|nr:hypothetical protein B0H13DRAFT_2044506 [Mycena leptocephala]
MLFSKCAQAGCCQLRNLRPFSTIPPQPMNIEKGSPEYLELAASGRLWEEYAQPGNITEFLRVQEDLKDWLRDLDEMPTLTSAVAHQSVAFEGNPLTLGDTVKVHDLLFGKDDMPLYSEMSKPLHALSSVSLPTPEELLPNKDPIPRENASRIASSPVFGQPDLRDIQSMLAVLLRGTASEALYNGLWGPKLPLGAFRGVPIQVPALMDRLLWRQETHARAVLHPLIFAARYETHLQPFTPFRTVTADSDAFWPVSISLRMVPCTSYHNIDREGYLHAVGQVHERRPDSLCAAMVEAQYDTLITFLQSRWR